MDSLLRHDASVATAHRFPVLPLPAGLARAHVAALSVLAVGLAAGVALRAAKMGPWAAKVATIEIALPGPELEPLSPAGVQPSVLAAALCATKESVRWHAAAWSPQMCHAVAAAVITAAVKHQLSASLILGVMLNESDLDENVVTKYRAGGRVYAQDSGLMGVRCVFDGAGRCANGVVRGMTAAQTTEFATNIDLGAQILARARAGDGVEKRVVRQQLADGEIVTTTKLVRCRHKNHAWWAHYNHGSFYIAHGFARHYPQRVAVLSYAWAQSLGLPHEELFGHPLTVTDPGQRPRTADQPVERRFRVLVDKIYSATGTRPASESALASLGPQR
jgi:hypothetical protein